MQRSSGQTARRCREPMDCGVSRSSEEASNDRGAKGWQTVRARKGKLMTVQTDGGKQKTTKLDRIGKRAKFKKDTVFNCVGHVVDLNLLRECYRELDGKKAIGIDGITKASYGVNLEERLQDLL